MAVNRYRLLSSLIVLLAVTGSNAQDASSVPSLVVNIVIDQLRSDYMDAFTPLYGQGGFQRLKEKAATILRQNIHSVPPILLRLWRA